MVYIEVEKTADNKKEKVLWTSYDNPRNDH